MSDKLEPRAAEKLLNSMEIARSVITRDYLCNLRNMEVAEIPEEMKDINISSYMRLYHFKKLVTDKDESTIEKLVTVLNSAASSNGTVITIIKGNKDKTDYYMGVVSKNRNDNITLQEKNFKSALKGNFPGLEMDQLYFDDVDKFNKSIFESTLNESSNKTYISSVSCIASLRDEDQKNMQSYVQGIEHLTDALRGSNYNIIIIADPISAEEIEKSKTGYESLYTQLSSYAQTILNFNENDTLTLTNEVSESISESIGESVTLSQSYSESGGWNNTKTDGSSTNKNKAGFLMAAGILAGAGAVLLTGGLAAPVIATAAAVGGSIGSAVLGSEGEHHDESNGEHREYSESSSESKGESKTNTIQTGKSQSEAKGSTQGRSIQFTNENKVVKELLKTIDRYIERFDKCAAYGAFNCAAYVLTDTPETNAIVANNYSALMKGKDSSLQVSYINNYGGEKKAEKIKQYLSLYSHPRFVDHINTDVVLTPASVSNSYETAVSLGLPKKSINGLPVVEMASFGRNVFNVNNSESVDENKDEDTNENKDGNKSIEIGKAFYMGADDTAKVNLDIESFAMHTFVTGSTGTGKSNYIYNIVDKLKEKGIKFLIIEPAKGEYKEVFGSQGDVHVYGTNIKKTPLLRLNPFSFPDDIHVLEHIDRLVEIFNACWPMYAAMPAVLKDAIEQAYVKKGWNLTLSECPFNTYPTFSDLLIELHDVMDKSAYSADTKNDYIGSLVTRVKSLTNGINGQIFCSAFEIENHKLFDENVIADISRVGSMETKALIMGILIMKLQEYRMAEAKGGNEPLRHITVLEEAHNILRRTSYAQGQESANLQGKSVEMITNSIAEMRTYGEGFIIADQSPGLMDEAVIRNTNTKIILRLPEGEDRELAGKSAALNENQIDEIAKLPVGVAVIYQNNWLEAVLCHTEVYKNDKDHGYVYNMQNDFNVISKFFEQVFGISEKLDLREEDVDNIKNWIKNIRIGGHVKDILKFAIAGRKLSVSEQRKVAYDLFRGKEMAKILEKTSDENEAISMVDNVITNTYNILNIEVRQRIRSLILEGIFLQGNTERLQERYDKVEFRGGCL